MLPLRKTSIYRDLAKKYKTDVRVIETICASPFNFAKTVMLDEKDEKDILFATLFKVKLKAGFTLVGRDKWHTEHYKVLDDNKQVRDTVPEETVGSNSRQQGESTD